MNKGNLFSLFTILMLTTAFNNCSEQYPKPDHRLTPQQTSELKSLSLKLKTSFLEEKVFFEPVSLPRNVMNHAVMQNFVQRIRQQEENKVIASIVAHSAFTASIDQSMREATFEELSSAAQNVLNDLTQRINTTLDVFFAINDTTNFNRSELTTRLIAAINDVEQSVHVSNEINDIEVEAILASCAIQREIVADIVSNAEISIYSISSEGRTKGFFKKLGRYIGSVIVSAAAGGIVGGIIGAIVGNGPGSIVGAVIGAAAGAVIGIYQASQDKCADNWNFQNRVPFVHWVDC